MGVAEQAAERFASLASMGMHLPMQSSAALGGRSMAETVAFATWRTRSLNALRMYLPAHDPTITAFDDATKDTMRWNVEQGIGVLQALAADAAEGMLFTRVASLITAEVFNDFLDMAEHLVKANHVHAAASLVGAVLEDALRRLADANKLKYAKRDGLDALNTMLAKEGVYNAVEQKRIDVWREVRNTADHGRFADVRPDDVREMLAGVTDFVGQHIK